MKRFLSLFLALIVAVGVCCSAPMTIEASAAVYASSFTPRTSIPTASDSWIVKYNTSNNCTRYVYARISEILNKDATSVLGTRPGADGFPSLLQKAGYTASSTPTPGSVMCTSGHVAIVESVNTSNGTLVVTEGHSWSSAANMNNVSAYLINGKSVLGYSTLTTDGNGNGTWFDIRKIYYNNSSAKYYSLIKSGGSSGTTTPSVSAATITEDFYYLKNKSTGDYLSVSNSEDRNEADVSHYSKMVDFQVKIKKNSNGYEMWFPNVSSTRVVNQWGDVPAAGARITLYTHSGNKTQSWIFQKYSDGYLIRSAYNTNLFMTINSYGQVILDNFTGGSGQIWYLEKVKPNPPAAPTVKMSKTSFAVGESVTISWNSVSGATSYWISAWKSSDHVINEASTSLSKTVSFSNAGTYSVAVAAIDAYDQQTLSEWVTFTVYKPYTVKYDANGGTGAPSSQTKKSTSNLTLSSTKPTRTGYTFLGWGTSASDTTVDYAPGATYSTNANITLYAIWKINTYTVKFDANGGTGAPSSQTKTYGANLTLSTTKPTRDGYTFLGWGTSTGDTSVNYAPGGTYTKNEDEVLYAIWEEVKPNPPAAPVVKMSKTSFAVGESVTISWNSVPGATSYWISAWKSSDHVINEASTSLSKTVSFENAGTYSVAVSAKDAYGQQTLSEWVTFTVYEPYTVKYDANGGTGAPALQTKKSISDLALSSTKPTRSGYTFLGWGTSASDTTVDYAPGAAYSTNDDITLYAIWQCNHTLGTTIVNAKEPTYTETGYTGDKKCDTCGKIISTGSAIEKLALSAPKTGVANTQNGIKVTWNAVEGAESYKVFRKQLNGSTWSAWSSPASGLTTTSYVDKTVKFGVTYIYAVVAVNESVTSSFVQSSQLTYNVAPTVTIANGTDGIKVSWNVVSGATSYKVFRRELNTSNNTWSAWSSPASGLTGNAYVDKNIKYGVTYSYAVIATNGTLSSSYIATSGLKCTVNPAPVAPTVTIANGTDGIKVTWNLVSGATSYKVFRRQLNADNTWSAWSSPASGLTTTSYIDKTVNLGVTYSYAVVATNSAGSSNYVATSGLKCNIAPTVTIANGTDGIKVTWNKINGATSYKVFRRELNTTNNTWGAWSSPASGLTTTSYVDKTAKFGTKYSYAVIAVNSSISSGFVATSVLQCGTAPKVTIGTATNGIRVNWNAISGVDSYIVYKKTYNATTKTWGGWTTVAQGCKGTTVVDTTTVNGTYYMYTVRASKDGFNGSFVQSNVAKYVK